jgi:Phosphotransferase enzyme family
MTNSPRMRYRDQLAVLATDAAILQTMDEASARCPWWAGNATWRRTYGTFHPDREAFATLVFQSYGSPQVIFQAEVLTARPLGEADASLILPARNLGWIRIRQFPADPSLTTLAAVLASHPQPTVLRYRPARRCTVGFETTCPASVVKVYPKRFAKNGRGEQIHASGQALWRASLRGELRFAVARPQRWDPETRSLWQERWKGVSALPTLWGSEGPAMAYRMGQAAGSLTGSALKPDKVFDHSAQLSASRRHAEELARRVPCLVTALDALLNGLAGAHDGARPLRPIHGDLDASQWLHDGPRLCLLDFEDFALGDPELDVATFLNELEIREESRAAVRSLSQAFLAGYQSIAAPLNRELLGAYLAHKRLFRALSLARSLRPDGDERAAQLIRHALQALPPSLSLLPRFNWSIPTAVPELLGCQ